MSRSLPAEPDALHIRLLGDVDIRRGDTALAPLESARAVSLLGYLLVHRGAHQSRQRLAFLLWPDSTETQARTNLRHVLHTLRRGLPDADRFIEVTPRTLCWREDAPYRLDVGEFEQALADGDLEAAVDTYTGDLIEESYDDWVLEERERLRAQYVGALERLLLELEERGDVVAAIRCAERLVRGDSLGEDGHRALMRLHDARGDRARALRAYHAYAATVQQELGVEPSAATRAAYEALLLVDADATAHAGAPSPIGPPLVGRAPERARLAALWGLASRGVAQLVLVTGEPGIGKSRLVEELRSWCAHGGALTAEARAYAAEGAVSYGPVVSWLRSEPLAARLRRLESAHLTELARLLPELQVEQPELPRPQPLPEGEQRQRLFTALAGALLAAGAPLLLVADDVHWFDLPTLQFLHYFVRADATAPVLIAATARREEVDPRDPLSELVAGLQALDRFAEIELGRLGRSETALLAERISGSPLAEDDVERLFTVSEGNPLFLVEAVQAAPEGAVTSSAKGRKVQAVIAARLARLSAPASELAGLAAAIGREFSAPVLADASDLDEQAFVRGLDELWRRGIVRAHALDAYDFSHGRIREAAYEALGPAARRRHHLRVAGALVRTHASDLDAVSMLLAAQYEAAGASDEAATWYVRAAHSAQRLHDHAAAVRALERALGHCQDLPASPDRDRRELAILSALPAPLNALDGYLSERLVRVHERALGLAASLGVETEAPLVRSMAVAALTRGDFDAARDLGEQLRARAEREGDGVLTVESEWVLAIAAYWSGDLRPARAHLEAALARWRPEHRVEHLLRYGQDTELACRIRLAHTLWLLGHEEDAARARDEAVASAEVRQHPHSRALVHVFGALIAIDGRDEARLRAHAAVLAAQESGAAERVAHSLAGFIDVLDGRAEQGLDLLRRVVDEAEWGEPAAPGEEGLLRRVLVEACAAAADAPAGLAAADRALQTGNEAQPWSPEIRRLRAVFLHALGAPRADVVAELERAAMLAEDNGAVALATRARDTLGRVGAKRGEERLGNGWSSTMPPIPYDIPRPDHPN